MSIYDEVEIEDMTFIARLRTFYFPCPCGDKFFITLDDLMDGEDIAKCPSCSLIIRVVFDADELEERYGGELVDDEEDAAAAVATAAVAAPAVLATAAAASVTGATSTAPAVPAVPALPAGSEAVVVAGAENAS